jgi:hypothetical protein
MRDFNDRMIDAAERRHEVCSMNSHRDQYPEQYSHPLVGKRVHIRTHSGFEIDGTVERVVNTRFGLLCHIDSGDPNTAWSIHDATVIE